VNRKDELLRELEDRYGQIVNLVKQINSESPNSSAAHLAVKMYEHADRMFYAVTQFLANEEVREKGGAAD
jgi:hypothetical protein